VSTNLIQAAKARFAQVTNLKTLPIAEFVQACSTDASLYRNVYERLIDAIGKPEIVNTASDPRLSRIHSNRVIRVYPSFGDFFGNGLTAAIDDILSFLRSAAAGQEESRQVLYLLGPVGSSKSSLADRLKRMVEREPLWVVTDEAGEMSPCMDNPLAILHLIGDPAALAAEANIPVQRVKTAKPSPWLVQKFKDVEGDLTKLFARQVYPSELLQLAVSRVEPADENNQDVSSIVGKTNLRALAKYDQDHPYSYNYCGGLCRANQGVVEFVEIFKAPIKTLHPLLVATQENIFQGTENIGAMPFEGLVLAHSNESEWKDFRADPKHEAFIDRIVTIRVPYCLSYSDEVRVYEKILSGSAYRTAPIAPHTLEMLAQWSVLTRLVEPENSTLYAKLKVYNGENVKDTMPNAKPYEEYREAAGVEEGMSGMSTRFAFKVLSRVFNLRPDDVQANPVDLMYVIQETLKSEQLPDEKVDQYVSFIKNTLQPRYFEDLEKVLRAAYLDSFDSFGQNLFDRYVAFAAAWLADEQCKDPETHDMLDRKRLDQELESIERAAGINNPKDFRSEITHYVLRYQSKNGGANPPWQAYEKMKVVIEKRMFSATENILPVISFGPKQDRELEEKHTRFVERMMERGYSPSQIKQLVSWWANHKKAS
jgi:serine protein kinase